MKNQHQSPAFSFSFRQKLFAVIVLLLVTLQAITSLVVYKATEANVTAQIYQRIKVGKRLFAKEFENRDYYLTSAVGTIAKDWAFREAAGTEEASTIKSAMENQRLRLGAVSAVYKNTSGDILTITGGGQQSDRNTLLQTLKSHNWTSKLLINHLDAIYEFVFSPVKAPIEIGSVGMAFRIDKSTARNFEETTDLNIQFLLLKNNIIVQNVHDNSKSSYFVPLSIGQQFKHDTEIRPSKTLSSVIQSSVILKQKDDIALIALIQESTQGPLEQFHQWWVNLFIVFLLALGIASLVAAYIARSVTNPILTLLNAAHRIATGKYEEHIPVTSRDEIGKLASEFQTMQQAIAEREKEIRYRAEHDQLTNLLSRDKFIEELDSHISDNSPAFTIIAIFNINRFKEVNDTLGHNIGDALLQQVATRIIETFPGTKVSRLGADQFSLFCDLDTIKEIQQIIERITSIFQHPFDANGIDILMSATSGFVLYPEHESQAIALLRLAEVAMYNAKRKHLASEIYDRKEDSHSIRRLTLMSDLPQAIHNNELELYYQPTLALSNDNEAQLYKVECLSRWNHPVHGLIPPDDFISLAEQSGVITDLTAWAIDAALQQCQRWHNQGHYIGVAVNISAVDLYKGELNNLIPSLLQKYFISSEFLTIEVTESEIMQDPDHACAILHRLRKIGVRLSIDDYGTGYSSLAQMKQLPVDEIKIDKSFVMDLDNNEDDKVIVTSTIKLGHNMGLHVVAEGIESRQTLEHLTELGCNYAQGYYISKPLTTKDFDLWIANSPYAIKRR